jgi:hypothetical protein
VKDEVGLVLNDPLDDLAAVELHGLGNGGRKVDVPLDIGFAFDELDFGRETHRQL